MPNLTLTEPTLGDSLSNGVSEDLCLGVVCQYDQQGPIDLGDYTLTDDGQSIQQWDNYWQSYGYNSGYNAPGNLNFDWGKLAQVVSADVLPLIQALVQQGASPAAATVAVAAKNPGKVGVPGVQAIQEKMPVWGWVAIGVGSLALLGLLGIIAFKK